MKQLIKKIWPVFSLVLIWLIFTYPHWLKGLVPAPLDLLVGFFSPWQATHNIPIKNPAIADVVNQIIPFKIFTIQQLKQKIIPLWNPYNFSGTPHAANWQSAVFYPLNLLMIVFDFITGWSLYVLLQPLLAGIFTYCFARQIKISKTGSIIASLSFMFSGFITSWLQWGTLGHAILWLPLSLWSIEKYIKTLNTKYLILNTIVLSLSLLAGHLQISLYLIITALAYFLAQRPSKLSSRQLIKALISFFLPFFLVSFQLFPTIELYFNSFRGKQISADWFNFFRIPISQLITFIAPDFFGHPTTRNKWGQGSYVEMMGYIGLIPLMFAISNLSFHLKNRKKRQINFFLWLILISLGLSLRLITSKIILWLRLPIFASSSPARIICLISFSLAILAGIGWDRVKTKNLKTEIKYLTGIFIILWLATFLLPKIFNQEWISNLKISQRNLIFPSIILVTFLIGSFVLEKLKNKYISKKTFSILYSLFCILLISVDLFRFHHKYTPYTPREYFYPTFDLRQKLENLTGIDRTFGLVDSGLNLPFKLYIAEGYDPLYPIRYSELTSAHKDGKISTPDRSSSVTIGKNELYTMPLINLLGIKYVIQPSEHGAAPWELHLWEYPQQFEQIYDSGVRQLFVNKQALPRFFTTNNFRLEIDKQSIIDNLLKSENLNQTILLEENPPIEISPNQNPTNPELTLYSANKIEFNLNSDSNTLLYLSDNYYPGWQAYINKVKTPILRANYSFRTIAVPSGQNQIIMKYQPISFTIGLAVSALSLVILLVFFLRNENIN